MTWIKKESDGTHKEFNFVAPASADGSEEVLFPIGKVATPDYRSTIAVDVTQMETFLQPGALTGNLTINLTIDEQVTKGAKLHLKLAASGAALAITFGTGFAATPVSISVSSGKVAYMSFVFDGAAFLPMYEIPT